jgi:solute carrier family 25 phosphate transporter 3
MTGWSPTFWGYSVQGGLKYGGYEFFKKFYGDMAGEENFHKYKTLIYLAGSASAEFIADIGLCPFEAVKVRMQTSIPPFATGTLNGISTITAKEGFGGLYKGLYPLWGRQIPYTMMKFASFETIVEQIYAYLPGSKADYGKGAQTAVSFTGGYAAGILCAIVSHPADVLVSKLNATRQPGESFGGATGRIYKDIGFGGLWNGLPVRIVMIGTLTGLQWMSKLLVMIVMRVVLIMCVQSTIISRSSWVCRRRVGRRRRRRRGIRWGGCVLVMWR